MNGLTCTISMGYVFFNPYKWSYAALLITGDGKKFMKRYPKIKIQVSWTVQPMMLGRCIGARNDVLSCLLYNFLPGPSKGCQLNPNKWRFDTLWEPFGTPLKVLVYSLLSSKNFLTSSNIRIPRRATAAEEAGFPAGKKPRWEVATIASIFGTTSSIVTSDFLDGFRVAFCE